VIKIEAGKLITKIETVTAKNENKLRHVGFDCILHALFQMLGGANAPELTSLGLVGHGHGGHELRDTSCHRGLIAFTSKDGNNFTPNVVESIRGNRVRVVGREEDVHRNVITGSVMKKIIVKTNRKKNEVGVFSDHVVQNLLECSVADFEEVYMLITYQDQESIQ
jgi:hypothetical protein